MKYDQEVKRLQSLYLYFSRVIQCYSHYVILQIVTIAVMVILVTAPAGAAAIKLTAPRFLKRKEPNTTTSNDTELSV